MKSGMILKGFTTGDILRYCHFRYPSYHYLRDERIEDAEEDLLKNEDLMLDIYERFGNTKRKAVVNMDKIWMMHVRKS